MANGALDDDVRERLREVRCQLLIDRIREDQYPSSTMMDMVERDMKPEQAKEYAKALLDKVAEDNYPSLDIMRRLMRL